MTIFEAFREDCVCAGATPADKPAALQLIAETAKQCPALANLETDAIRSALSAREELGSTGFGGGIAIPHCRLKDLEEFVIGLVTVPAGVPFDAMDEQPVKVMVFIIAPASASNQHIRLLSAISQVLAQPAAINEILAESTPQAIRESFLRHCRDDVETKDHQSKNLLQIFVQEETLCKDVLTTLTAMPSCSASVIESNTTNEYLSKMPLFGSFWTDSDAGYSRIILATVEKRMTNETIRQIDRLCGGLDNREDVLLLVQDVFYAAGKLAV